MRIAQVNLGALQHNFQQIKKITSAKILAMVKSNAYGHGMIPISLALREADGFGVACFSEAIKLRKAGIKQPIVLMSGMQADSELEYINQYELDVVLHQFEQLDKLLAYSFSYLPKLWIKINTGMNRLGFRPDHIARVFEKLSNTNQHHRLVWMMHFANSDDPSAISNFQQLALFEKTIQALPGEKTAANSGALLSWPQVHFDWVRPGIMLYGISPFSKTNGVDLGLKPVMTLLAQLISVYSLKKGEKVGYGGTWECPENMPMGVISLGYGDGYPRHAGRQGAMVCIHDTLCPLIGQVSMDLMTVDLRPCANAKVGDTVILWGDALPIEQVAAQVNTIGYELICHVSSRVEFQYDTY